VPLIYRQHLKAYKLLNRLASRPLWLPILLSDNLGVYCRRHKIID